MKKVFRFIVLFMLGVSVLVSGSFAQEYNCQNPQFQQEMNYCAYQDYLAADRVLNKQYQRAIAFARQIDAVLPENLLGAEEALRQAQRAWIPFRDAACVAEGFISRGGTMEPLLVSSCLAFMTRQRTETLVNYADMGS